jgi:hypothetical protein
MLNIVKEMEIKQKYRLGNKNAMNLNGCAINEQDRTYLDLAARYSAIDLSKMPDKVRTKKSEELNFYIPEKWNY